MRAFLLAAQISDFLAEFIKFKHSKKFVGGMPRAAHRKPGRLILETGVGQ